MSESFPAAKPKRPTAPRDLGDAGKRVWRHIWSELQDGLVLDERELLLLREACGVADDLERLDGMITSAEDERTVLRVLSERRQQRLAFGRLLAQIELAGEPAKTPTQRRASRAATVRWRSHNADSAERARRQIHG
jgi:hypothetical protein